MIVKRDYHSGIRNLFQSIPSKHMGLYFFIIKEKKLCGVKHKLKNSKT